MTLGGDLTSAPQVLTCKVKSNALSGSGDSVR